MAQRIECYYGPTGSAKSESLAAVIEQIYVQNGLTSRVIIGDGSKATYTDRGLVDAKVVELVDYSIRPWPLTTFSRLTQGWWPADVNDPESPLLAPKPDVLKKLGVFGVEGLSVGSQYIMGDQKGGLAEQAARGIKIGENSPVRSMDVLYDAQGNPIKDSGPGTVFGGNPMSHFGFAQRRMLSNIENTKVFPNIVIWTAHERGAVDKVSGEKIVGPEAGGEALTASLPRYFNNTLHFTTAAKVSKAEKDDHTDKMVKDVDAEWRIYTRDHYNPDPTSPTMTKYKAVTRGGITEAMGMPQYLTSDIPGEAILKFYQILADTKAQRAGDIAARRAEAEARIKEKAEDLVALRKAQAA